MPKFDVMLTYTLSKNLTFEVSAKDEDTAQERVQKVIDSLAGDEKILEKLEEKYDAFWEEDIDDITIEEVTEQ